MPETARLRERIPYKPYRKNGPLLKEGGYAAVRCDGENLILSAILRDSDIHSDATADFQPFWMLGDVLEFFIWVPPRRDYFEFQLSSNGKRLQIHLHEFYICYDLEFEELIEECGMTAKTRLFPEKNCWYGTIKVPLATLGITSDQLDGIRFMSGRYNRNQSWENPEISATIQIQYRSFHNPPEWTILRTR